MMACVSLVFLLSPLRAQEITSLVLLPPPTAGELRTSGDARIDLLGMPDLNGPSPAQQVSSAVDEAARRKSPWLAAGMSILVPGAGEFYTGDYWKSAAFFAVDVALWIFAYNYDKKGDRQTDFFQNFANQNWSVVKYAQYAQDNLTPPNGPYNWLIPNTEGRPPWDRVNWSELNRMEQDIGGYYSHVLPPYGQQQYYELIGKYPQFNQGWDDSGPTFNYGDPLTPNFLWYAGQRGLANRYYEKATTFVTIALVNHIVSAFDAAFSAASWNKKLQASLDTQAVPTAWGGMQEVPVVKLTYGL
jgi:hypothetical protein